MHTSRLRLLFAFAVLLWAVRAHAQDACTSVPAASPPNRKVVISDLHLGSGRDSKSNAWQPLEDFRFAPSFHAFLDHVAAGGSTDLIIAGDFIDFWQVIPELDAARPSDEGASEQESVRKLAIVLNAHRDTFQALKRFASTGRNRVVVVPGNHDVDLAWPAVQKQLKAAIQPSEGRVHIASPCYEADGIHVEHGHQFDEANRFAHPAQPFTTVQGVRRLETNWGTTFMSRFYNEVERRRSFIDNLYPEVATAVLALRHESAQAFSLPQAGRLAVMLARDQKALDNLGFLVRTLGSSEPAPTPKRKTLEELLKLYKDADPELGAALDRQLQESARRSDADAALAAIDPADWRNLQAGIVKAPTTLGAAAGIDALLQGARRIVVRNPSIYAVIMGHSHETDRTDVTRLPDVGPVDKWYVNTGCWQKVLAIREVRARNISWGNLNIDDDTQFPLRFSYVVIEQREGRFQKPERFFWTK
jgi:UDP-2,3-diacylglucosamine pyrophosphatase LpxH